MNDDHHSSEGSAASASLGKNDLSLLEQQVEAILYGELDTRLVEEYISACEIVPNLVRTESRISDFLRAEGNNVRKAAERLARYWKVRKENFRDRWLLRMDQTGSGALTSAQIDILRSGYLKPVVSKESDCPVIYCDFSLLPKTVDTISHPCVVMYHLTHLPGEVRAVFIVRSSWGKFFPTIHPDIQKIFGCTATIFKSVHIVRAHEEGREYLLDYLTYRQHRLNEKVMKQSSIVLAGNSSKSTLQLLLNAGFDRNAVPHILGGNLNDQSTFAEWVRGRLTKETVLVPALISCADRNDCNNNRALTVSTSRRTVVQRPKEWVTIVKRTDESDESYRKRRNALYVKRSYHRRKLELTALEGQVDHARTMNQFLKSEHVRLKCLWKEANRILYDMNQATTGG